MSRTVDQPGTWSYAGRANGASPPLAARETALVEPASFPQRGAGTGGPASSRFSARGDRFPPLQTGVLLSSSGQAPRRLGGLERLGEPP